MTIPRTVRAVQGTDGVGEPHALAKALGLAVIPAVSLGFARFAYALVLPAMRTSLDWSFATAGTLTTANAVGYLAGALAAPVAAARLGERTVLLGGVLVTAASLAASALSGAMAVLLVLRLIAGIAGAAAFIIGGSLAARLGASDRGHSPALLLGVYFAGGGLGVALSGALVPAVLGASHWRAPWLLLGVLSLAVVPGCLPALGTAERRADGAAQARRERWPARTLAALLVSYGLFGAGYIAYMTFIVAFLRQHGAENSQVTVFWVVLGVAAALAGFAWSPVLGRLTGGRGSALLMGVVTVGAALPLVSASTTASYVSALVFGVSFLSVVTAVTACARQSLPARHWTAAIAGLTTVFAIGQCLGPVLAGTLSDGPSGIRAGLAIGAVLLAAGAIAALAQRQNRADAAA
ncbi:YbfB/YjiJ family MFS transporter [Streptomyces montanisoli]|uniref:YbfB/YjiJ family MFS transporter n=1 Tax=Streptomyces montanisoli TaxID=2798581 RepID=A0A940MAG7_9ACTN|nr:YbfB/YjiJ family MFS transporter [Streptomyces montanisoli]MBP0456087.1 YbfB/YjiJ family MFS transporter [Streptomyces montanisoli]